MIPPPILFMLCVFGLILNGWGVSLVVLAVKEFQDKEWLTGFASLTFAVIFFSLTITGVWAFLAAPGAT